MSDSGGETLSSTKQQGPQASAGLPRALVILLGSAALVVSVVGLKAVAWLAGPLLLALVIVIAVYPLKTWLLRKGWPAWVTVLALVVLIYGTLLVLTAFLYAATSQLAAFLEQNTAKSQALVNSFKATLTKLGVDPTQAGGSADAANLSKYANEIGAALSGLTSIVTSIVLILALLLFLTAESGGTPRRMNMIAAERPHMMSALAGFVHGTRNYLIVTTVFGLIVAVLDSAALAIMGIPLVLLWGVLSFLTNFIPNIGFIIGLAPPALVALLVGGWQLSLAVIIVYCVLNAIVQSLIQPHFIGDSVGLSATVTFAALLFWAWVLGGLGALLAIPATLLFKAIFVDSDPRARWVEALLGSEPARPKPDKRARGLRRTNNGHATPSTEPPLSTT